MNNSINESRTTLLIIHWSRYPVALREASLNMHGKYPHYSSPKEPIRDTSVFPPYVKVQCSSCS